MRDVFQLLESRDGEAGRLVQIEQFLGGLAAFLATLRFAKIPWFVFLGYLLGSAAVKTKGYICPNCKKPFNKQFENPVGGFKATGLEVDTFDEPCPHCGSILVHNAATYEIISHKPKRDSEPTPNQS